MGKPTGINILANAIRSLRLEVEDCTEPLTQEEFCNLGEARSESYLVTSKELELVCQNYLDKVREVLDDGEEAD